MPSARLVAEIARQQVAEANRQLRETRKKTPLRYIFIPFLAILAVGGLGYVVKVAKAEQESNFAAAMVGVAAQNVGANCK